VKVGPFQLQLQLKRPCKISRFTLSPPSHINTSQTIKSLSIQATMPATRNRGSRRHGSTAPHPYADPVDQFALAFGTVDVSNTHRGTDDTPESQNNEGDGSTSPAANNPNDNESDPIGRRLAEYRENFNPESIRKSSKASSTFDKHQSNHERLLVWLLDNKPEYLHDEFLQQLNDADAHVDYQVPTHSHTTYRRRGGNKSLEVRMREYRMKCLRVEAKKALGTPGMPPTHPTVRFELLEGDVDCFLNFISSIRKENGGLLKSGAYTAFRSSFTYLFHRYKYVPSRAFEKELKEAMEGVKRFTNQAAQAGEGNLWDGDRPLTWGLYEQFNKWFMAEGTEDGIFAAAFSKLTCNLACRGNSTSQVCTKHMKWVDDCLEIRFAHGKDQQRGKF
jgi:hypothetical protein